MSEEKCEFYNTKDGLCNCSSMQTDVNKHWHCKDNIFCYYKQLQLKDKMIEKVKELLDEIKFEAEFNGNDESVQKIFSTTQQALAELRGE